MTDITEFVRARLDEDEREARICLGRGGSGHRWYKVLAQVAAMRAIVADCADYIGSEAVTDGLSARTLERFAAIWSSHPDYDPAWAPEGE